MHPDIDKHHTLHIDALVQERRNSIANALELRLSCAKPSILSMEMRTGFTRIHIDKLTEFDNYTSQHTPY